MDAMATRRKTPTSAEPDTGEHGPRVLKKYPNRRLYDTRTSAYITLADAKQMVMDGEPFEVRDARTGEDLTRSILLQIILEEETGGMPIFSTPMLAQLIRYYGHAMQGLMGAYLERNLQTFIEFQQHLVPAPTGILEPSRLATDAWSKWMQSSVGQAAPAGPMGGLMTQYLEQSKQLFDQMKQMSSGGGGLFGMPGFGAGSPAKSGQSDDAE